MATRHHGRVKTPTGDHGLLPPPVTCRTAGREAPDMRHVGSRAFEPAGNVGQGALDPRNGPGKRQRGMVKPLRGGSTFLRFRSETPRPSSRETATPPRWAAAAADTVAALPSVRGVSQEPPRAERTEAGPGREQVAVKSVRCQSRPSSRVRDSLRGPAFLSIAHSLSSPVTCHPQSAFARRHSERQLSIPL